LLFFSLAIYLFTANFSYKIILIGIVTSIFCQIGDLFFSFLKRRAKIKDSGNFLPGHGGILDRFDGIFLGIPAGFFTLIYVIK
ncbi:MAG: phosphatidate cytidylyltransferase, partial [Pseudomonadota bacterium]|nr:phosphatidate cytidylyltransferase [Pseudomonadota bacterium]